MGIEVTNPKEYRF